METLSKTWELEMISNVILLQSCPPRSGSKATSFQGASWCIYLEINLECSVHKSLATLTCFSDEHLLTSGKAWKWGQIYSFKVEGMFYSYFSGISYVRNWMKRELKGGVDFFFSCRNDYFKILKSPQALFWRGYTAPVWCKEGNRSFEDGDTSASSWTHMDQCEHLYTDSSNVAHFTLEHKILIMDHDTDIRNFLMLRL